MNKKNLSERDICTKFMTPALQKAGWDIQRQVREEVFFTDGRIIVQGSFYARGKRKRADYILYYKKNIPIAIVEKVNGLMSLCDQLEKEIDTHQTTQEQWMQSCLREVV
jgi:type I restriction enzyme R subunit